MQSPETFILIERSMHIDRTRQYQQAAQYSNIEPRPGRIRVIIGQVLIAIGSTIAPEARPAHQSESARSLSYGAIADA